MVPTLDRQVDAAHRRAEADEVIRAYRIMLLARLLDEKLASLYRMGKIHGGVFLGKGQEALSVATGMALRKGDVFAPLIRDGAGRLAFDEPLLDAIRTYMGSPLGPMRARDGNVHRGRPNDGILPMISHLGAMISVVNGALMAHRFKGIKATVGAASIGDGATSTGSFHEALNQAAVEKLPLILIVANNRYAYSTPNERQFACKSLIDKAAGYGVETASIDGTNLWDCIAKIKAAVQTARTDPRPHLLIADLLRLCGHGEHDDACYVLQELRNSPSGRDCLQIAGTSLLKSGLATEKDLQTWRAEASSQIEKVVAQVQQEAPPDPYKEDWCAISTLEMREGRDLHEEAGTRATTE